MVDDREMHAARRRQYERGEGRGLRSDLGLHVCTYYTATPTNQLWRLQPIP